MKLLVRFSKLGGAVYMSHLDLVRCVQRTMRRAGIPVKYSQGFNPHQILSFAQALSLGVESSGEYFQTELLSHQLSPEAFVDAFNARAPEGVRALAAREMRDKRNAMAAVAAADYSIVPSGPYDAWNKAIGQFMDMDVLMYTKSGKGGDRQLDMRSRVYEAEFQDGIISCRLACGADNLHAAAFFKALLDIAGADAAGSTAAIKRRDLLRRNYAGKLVSLLDSD